MDLSQYIKDLIESYREKILSNIPVKNLIYNFRAKKILNDEDVEELENITRKNQLNNRFIGILLTRTDEDFYEFCKVLQSNQANAIKSFGYKLEEEALGNNCK